MRDWQDYASKRLGRQVERSDNGNLLLTTDEIRKITTPSLTESLIRFAPFVLAFVLIYAFCIFLLG